MHENGGSEEDYRSLHSITYEELAIRPIHYVRGLIGAALGGTVGYFAVLWLARAGLYAIILPAALTGLGCGLLSRRRSMALGVISAVGGVAAGLLTEWSCFPFADDDSFGFFVENIHHLSSVTLVLIALSGLFGFWFGQGREQGAWRRTDPRA